MRRWTEETDREADEFFPTLSIAEIRRRQDLAQQQIAMAYRQHDDDAMVDLQRMHDALTREMFRRTEPVQAGKRG